MTALNQKQTSQCKTSCPLAADGLRVTLDTQDRRHHHEPERTFHLASELSQQSGLARNVLEIAHERARQYLRKNLSRMPVHKAV